MKYQRAKSGGFTRDDDPGEPIIGKPRVSISEAEAEILSALAIGADVLEIGTGLGVSTRALARTANSVTTYDIDPWVHGSVWVELADDLDNVFFTHHPDRIVADVVFVDADHSTDAVRHDVQLATQVILNDQDPFGLIVAHDALDDKVKRGLGAGWTTIRTEHGLGLKIIQAVG